MELHESVWAEPQKAHEGNEEGAANLRSRPVEDCCCVTGKSLGTGSRWAYARFNRVSHSHKASQLSRPTTGADYREQKRINLFAAHILTVAHGRNTLTAFRTLKKQGVGKLLIEVLFGVGFHLILLSSALT